MADKSEGLAENETAELLSLGEKLIVTASEAHSSLRGQTVAEITTWVSRVGQLLRRLYKGSDQHFEEYSKAMTQINFTNIHSNSCTPLYQIQGVLRAVKHELDAGLMADLRKLLQASIFADFLEMAEHLLSEGYKDAAGVLIGGVMEDSLRKLAQSNGIPLIGSNGRPLTIDPLNVAIAKAGVYNALVHKQVTTWADLRNSAAHGHYDRYDAQQVKQMLLFVQKFCSDYLV